MKSAPWTTVHGIDSQVWPTKNGPWTIWYQVHPMESGAWTIVLTANYKQMIVEHTMVLTADYDQRIVDHGVHGINPPVWLMKSGLWIIVHSMGRVWLTKNGTWTIVHGMDIRV